MAEKLNKPSNVWGKPVPMKLFAAWEVDRTPPNCIPRLCTLNLTRLIVLKAVSDEMSSVILAVKMQSSKRTLRSHEMMVANNGLLDTELDLTFSLQYPHFLKRSGNNLQILLQRRKRYKNRAMLGFKTLAGGVINMAEVLQKPMDMTLDLLSSKEKNDVIARVSIFALSSQPVDHEDADHQKLSRSIQRVEVDNFSDEEEEYTSNEEGCDSEPAVEDPGGAGDCPQLNRRSRKTLNPKMYQHGEERSDPAERNIKQKFIALLKKFRIPETEVSDSEQYPEELEQELISRNPREFEDLIDELESMTDSGPDVDDISISSTPKPSLRPFFSSGTLTALDKVQVIPPMPPEEKTGYKRGDDNQESGTDQDNTDTSQAASSPPKSLMVEDKKNQAIEKDKKRLFAKGDKSVISFTKEKRSLNVKEKPFYDKSTSKDSECSPQKIVMEQLARIFPLDDSIPDHIFLISNIEMLGSCLTTRLSERLMNIVSILSFADLRAFFSCLVNKIQKFCNCNSRAPQTIKIGIIGQDGFVNSILRSYVEHFSSKSPEWQGYVNFLIVPLGASAIALCMANVDFVYGSQFVDNSWKDLVENCDDSPMNPEFEEIIDRLISYLKNVNIIWRMPIAEAMVTYKEKSSEDESSQTFIPFLVDVAVGMESVGQASVDSEDQPSGITLNVPGSSPPAASEKAPRENTTPPSSPSISVSLIGSNAVASGPVPSLAGETMDLQIDCWLVPTKGEGGKKNETSKMSLKSTFRTLRICTRVRNPDANSLTLSYVTKENKEKKQKIMRLGKKKEKEKEPESRSQSVENIHRLICSCRAPQSPLKVTIDGAEWNGVKFFQLTAQWQTHIKYFPVALFSLIDYD